MALVEILTLVHCADHTELIIAGVNMLSVLQDDMWTNL